MNQQAAHFETFRAAEEELRKEQVSPAAVIIHGVYWQAIYVSHEHGFTFLPDEQQAPRIAGARYTNTPCGRILATAEEELERELTTEQAADLLLDRFPLLANANEAALIAKTVRVA